jgi:hypothetical protein
MRTVAPLLPIADRLLILDKEVVADLLLTLLCSDGSR